MAKRTVRINRKKVNGETSEPAGMVEVTVGSNSGEIPEGRKDTATGDGEYTPENRGPQDSGGDEERTPTGRKKRKYGPRKGKRDEADAPENLTKILITSHLMLARLLDAQEL